MPVLNAAGSRGGGATHEHVASGSATWPNFARNPLAMFGMLVLTGIHPGRGPGPADRAVPQGLRQGDRADDQPPRAAHWFGTDDLGLDIFAEVSGARGSRCSSALLASALALAIGVPVGLIGGYYKGKVDAVLTGLTDIFLSLPMLPLMILMAAVWDPP